MAGFSAGSAFISVVPSLRGFGESVKSQLRGEDLEAPVKMVPEIDEREGEAKADETARKMSGKDVTFKAKLDTKEAEAQAKGAAAMWTSIGIGGLAVAGPAILGLGGLIGALAIPMAAVKLGMDGIKAAAAPLKPQFDGIKTAVSGAFQTGLQPAVANIRSLLPGLRTDLVGTAGSLSSMATQITGVVSSGPGLANVRTIFSSVNGVIRGLGPVLAVIVGAFLQMGAVFTQTLGAVMVPALQRFAQAFGQMAAQLTSSGQLQAAFSALFQLIGSLLQLLPPLLALGVRLMVILGPPLAIAIDAVVAALQVLSPILPYITLAIGAWVIVQWALNAAMAANPFVLVAIALGVLVVAVIYCWQRFQGFRDVVFAVWEGIKTAFLVAWSVLSVIFSAIGTALRILGVVIFTLLVAPFVIAWNIIAAIVSSVWNGFLRPIWLQDIVPALQFLGAVFTWLWRNITVPVWNGISAAVAASWNFVRDNIFNPIVRFIQGVLGPVFMWLWHNITEPVWRGISAAASAAWSFIQAVVFRPLMDGVHAVGQAFQFVSDWIGRAWDAIREEARRPVQWVVDVVYNNGIRPVWNGIAGLFGMPQLGAVQLAGGGVIPGFAPGVDSVPAMLSRGEGVLVPEAVRGLGPAFVGWANSHFSGGRSSGGIGTPQGGFSHGGIVHLADGGILGGIGSFLSGTGDFLMQLFTDPAGAVKGLFAAMLGDASNTPGGGSWTGALKALPLKFIDAVIQKAKDWIASLATLGGGGGGVQQWAGVAAEALALAGAPQSWLGLLLAQMNTESGGNPGAINLTDSNAQAGHPSQGLMQVIPSTFASYAGPLAGLGLLNPLANIYAAIKYVMGTYGSPVGVWGQGHGYDSGGWLPPGPSLTWNNTGSPEPVLTRGQWSDISAAARNGRGSGTEIHVHPSAPLDEASMAALVKRRLDFEEKVSGL